MTTQKKFPRRLGFLFLKGLVEKERIGMLTLSSKTSRNLALTVDFGPIISCTSMFSKRSKIECPRTHYISIQN